MVDARADRMAAEITKAVIEQPGVTVIVVTPVVFRNLYLAKVDDHGWWYIDKVIEGKRHTYTTIDDRQIEVVKDPELLFRDDVEWLVL